ncbi:unnamed protein product [Caenorhabditis sp. 36 PRJEB53466]|nr:unnamed protein product [Caenorhabditis sp. 36 PRJEB53466]
MSSGTSSSTPSFSGFRLQATDGTVVPISLTAMRQSTLLASVVDNCDGSDAFNEPIQCPNVTQGDILRLVVTWCERHQNDGPMSDAEQRLAVKELPTWDRQFLDPLDNRQLFSLICAANYLHIARLLHYSCKMAAQQSEGLTPNGMRKLYFGMDENGTPTG